MAELACFKIRWKHPSVASEVCDRMLGGFGVTGWQSPWCGRKGIGGGGRGASDERCQCPAQRHLVPTQVRLFWQHSVICPLASNSQLKKHCRAARSGLGREYAGLVKNTIIPFTPFLFLLFIYPYVSSFRKLRQIVFCFELYLVTTKKSFPLDRN